MKKMSFETASASLDKILEELGSEDTSLDRSLELYAKAAELIVFCDQTLRTAQIKIEEINAQSIAKSEDESEGEC